MSNTRKLRGRDWAPLSRELGHILGAAPPGQVRADTDRIAPGFADQLDAATAEAAHAHARFTARLRAAGQDVTDGTGSTLPADVRDQMHGLYLRVITEVAQGTRRHCPHFTLGTPAAAVAVVFDDWIACRRCAPLYARRPVLTQREEHTCDLCGRYRPRQTMDQVFPSYCGVILIIGTCPQCSARITRGTP
jgi:hypothetical protein